MKLRIFILLIFFACSVNWGGKAEAIVYEPMPEMVFPENNPWSKVKEELGRKLFFDPTLSGDDTISCSSCHLPDKSWSDGLPQSVGISKKPLKRNSPSILNSGFLKSLFWDGRAKSLEEQVLMPIQDKSEMDQHLGSLVKEIESKSDYIKLFESTFGDSEITPERLAMAIATFERTLVTGKTPYDRYWQGDKSAISPAAIRGMNLFSGKAKCSICHSGPLFTDHQFHNIGLNPDKPGGDKGRKNVTGEAFHRSAYKTPGLRGVGSTGPYMHDGSLPDLQSVIIFYDEGGTSGVKKSPFISPIHLNENEKSDLLEFLLTLGSNKSAYSSLNP